jgi:hypothetical protein
MHLEKTTILPTDDDDLARRMFRHEVFEEPVVLVVVHGTDEAAEKTVQRADRLAGQAFEPRRVIWARKPKAIWPIVKVLGVKHLGAGQAAKLQTCQAFSISLGDDVCDLVAANEPPPKLLRVFELYASAEAVDE